MSLNKNIEILSSKTKKFNDLSHKSIYNVIIVLIADKIQLKPFFFW